jgi:hypothetical protein
MSFYNKNKVSLLKAKYYFWIPADDEKNFDPFS